MHHFWMSSPVTLEPSYVLQGVVMPLVDHECRKTIFLGPGGGGGGSDLYFLRVQIHRPHVWERLKLEENIYQVIRATPRGIWSGNNTDHWLLLCPRVWHLGELVWSIEHSQNLLAIISNPLWNVGEM